MSLRAKIIWILSIAIWIASLIILIISLTDLLPENPFKEYRFLIGIGFLTISGFIRQAYKKSKSSLI